MADKRKLTPAQRTLIARQAAAARWGNKRSTPVKQMLRTMDDIERFCRTMALSGNLPPELYAQLNAHDSGDVLEIAAARALHIIQLGLEVGLQPAQSLSSICVLNGKPLINGDAQLALVLNSGKATYVKETFDGVGEESAACCMTLRSGEDNPYVTVFTAQDAIIAGLWGQDGAWTTHSPRMLKYKARAFCLRDKYPDVLKGLAHSTEEMEGEVIRQRYDTEIAPHDAAKKLTTIVDGRMLHNTTQANKGDKNHG